MPTLTLLQQVRKPMPMYLNPSVAACAGLRLEDLQQIVAGVFYPTDEQLRALARRMQIDKFPVTE
jgi:hypothetical protein